MIYLDHAATAPVWPSVREAMEPWLFERFANASSVYASAREARKAVEDARETIAAAVQARPDEVIFTSGGTEADNIAVLGGARRARASGRAGVVVSAIEHHAVLDPAARLAREGHMVRHLPVTRDGVVDTHAVGPLDGVGLVSVMTVNNETGVIQPVREISGLAREAGALFHTDAVQALSWIGVDARDSDLVSLASHKLGGPKGVGALIVRRGVGVEPIAYGGGQERGIRSGTYDVAAIVGFGAAVTEVTRARASRLHEVRGLRDRLEAGLASLPGVSVSGAGAPRTAGACHMTISGVEAEPLLLLLDGAGIAASAGSACSSGAAEPSHVLLAMGRSAREAAGVLRLTLGYGTTQAEVDTAVAEVTAAVNRLRR